jgi:hypothetical protein
MSVSDATKAKIRKQAQYCCEYCKSPEEFLGIHLEIDHVVPLSKDGSDLENNLCAACRNCNGSKLDAETGIDPETEVETRFFNPRIDSWATHFMWSQDFSTIIGITPTGRATVNRLQVNRPIIVKARNRWRKAGWEPLIK